MSEKLEAVEEQLHKLYGELACLKIQISNLTEKRKSLVKEKYENLNIVHGLYLYLKHMDYPLCVYNKFGIDDGTIDTFKHVTIKVVEYYDYTDVVGLTEEQFKELEELIEKRTK